jgi:hypothetical protein
MAIQSDDILIEDDLQITSDGDIEVGVADNNNIMYITYTYKGQFYKYPLLGVGIIDFIHSPDDDARILRKEINRELEKDGYELDQIQAIENDEGNFTLEIKATKRANTI